MGHLKVSGNFKDTNKTSIDAYICNAYEKGESFEEIEQCLTCGLKVSFSTKLLIASGILIREIKSNQTCAITEGLEVSGPSVIMKFFLKAETQRSAHNILYCKNLKANFLTTYNSNDSVFVIILSIDFYLNLIHQTTSNQAEFPDPIFNISTGNLFEDDLGHSPHNIRIPKHIFRPPQ